MVVVMMGMVVVMMGVMVVMVWWRWGRGGGRSRALIGGWGVSAGVGLAQQTLPLGGRRRGGGRGGGGTMEEGVMVVMGGAVVMVVMGRLGGLGVHLSISLL